MALQPSVEMIVTVDAASGPVVVAPALAEVGLVDGVLPSEAVRTLTQSPTASVDEAVLTCAVILVFEV